MPTLTRPPVTAGELELMPDGDQYELVDGCLLEVQVGAFSAYIGTEIARVLGNYVHERRLGAVISEVQISCFRESPEKVRKPDVAYFRNDSLPGGALPVGICRFVPDLVIEVTSPNDLVDPVEEKVGEYLRAGVPMIWVVYPKPRTIRVHRGRLGGQLLDLDDTVDGSDVLPGFRCRVAELIPPASPAPAAAPQSPA